MSQNITLLGASYTGVPSVQLPKTGGGLASFDDTTDANAVASDIAQGKTAYVNGVKLVGTSQGGGTDGYTLTNIVPSQSVTATTAVSNAYMVQIPTYTDVLEPGYAYLVNYDGDDYVLWCYEGWTQEYLIGDNQIVDNTYIDRLISPFTIDYGVVDDELIFISRDTTAHTIKVDKITFIDPTATLIPKTITQNGTYNASSDNADGYSSVTVNVSGGSSGNFKKGSTTITEDYTTAGNRVITSLANIGFTPKCFYMWISNKSAMSGKQYTILRASFESDDNGGYIRSVIRYSNTSNSLGGNQNVGNWTTQTNYHLYNDGTNIYYRTTTGYNLFKDSVYNWVAVG